jgi:hypothetical protein
LPFKASDQFGLAVGLTADVGDGETLMLGLHGDVPVGLMAGVPDTAAEGEAGGLLGIGLGEPVVFVVPPPPGMSSKSFSMSWSINWKNSVKMLPPPFL